MDSLGAAIQALHERYHIPHIVITSVSLQHPDHPAGSLCVVGSTMTSDWRARPFKIVFPAIDCYFSGTGDMFAALMVVRIREAVFGVQGLNERESWVSEDDVAALDLPLARAAEKVLASMHEVLDKTCKAMVADVAKAKEALEPGQADDQKTVHLLQSRASELKLVRNLESLRYPDVQLKATAM